MGVPHLDSEDMGLVGVFVRVSRAVPSKESFNWKENAVTAARTSSNTSSA